jgi:hypothetical protein
VYHSRAYSTAWECFRVSGYDSSNSKRRLWEEEKEEEEEEDKDKFETKREEVNRNTSKSSVSHCTRKVPTRNFLHY